MKLKFIAILTALTVFLVFTADVSAHPGRTASDGCHYCRTNCDKWGIPWNARHCHRGGAVAPPPVLLPTATPAPNPTVAESETNTGDVIAGLVILGVIGGGLLWLGRSVWRRLRKQTPPNE